LVEPIQSQSTTFKEQQSKFISFLHPYNEVSSFKSWISKCRKEYHDASHVCWAYRINLATQLEENASDAGEPSGTAGLPILNEMKKSNLVNCGLIVIRYFGGTKLGKRGLMDAYGKSARDVINKTTCKEWIKTDHYLIKAPLEFYGDLSQSMSKFGGKIISDHSSEIIKWEIEVQSGRLNELIQIIRYATKGKGDLEKILKRSRRGQTKDV